MSDIRVIAWDSEGAVAVIDDVRCRIRRSLKGVRWICDIHGTGPAPHCGHLTRFAEHPAEPETRRPTGEPA